MNRRVFLLDLKDDPELIAQYEAWHAPGKVPDGVVQNIRGSGIARMDIFRSGNRLVMIVNRGAGSDASQDDAHSDPAVTAWEALMDRFQQRLPWAAPGQKWVPAERIFSLDEQG